MGLIREGLKQDIHDEALVNAFRLHFLVDPERFVGQHNSTHVYTAFLVLDIADILLGISTLTDESSGKKVKSIQNLSARGLSESSLIHWRKRLCADLRKSIENSAIIDLLVLVDELDKRVLQLSHDDPGRNEDEVKAEAEQGMRKLLGLKESRWEQVLKSAGW
jgi:hypothetical protein